LNWQIFCDRADNRTIDVTNRGRLADEYYRKAGTKSGTNSIVPRSLSAELVRKEQRKAARRAERRARVARVFGR
jgi:hypothetical protein